MSDQRVKQIETPISEAEMTYALINAVKELYGITLSKDQVALLIAQNNLETNHRKSMHNYNIGNITHINGDGWDYFAGGDKSRDKNGNWKPITLKFRSYPDLDAAAKDYVKNIHNRNGGKVWQQIINPSIKGFSQALKDSKYYEADESAYTNALTGGTNLFNKSDSYSKAISGQFEKSKKIDTNKPYDGSSIASTYSSETLTSDVPILDKIDNFLKDFMSSVASDKKSYQKLNKNNLLIKIYSNDIIDSLEFSRILCTALDEETQSDSIIHANEKFVEVNCDIYGPKNICLAAVSELCNVLENSFKIATAKIGGIEIKTNITLNKKSNLQEVNMKLAQSAFRQFKLKFIK